MVHQNSRKELSKITTQQYDHKARSPTHFLPLRQLATMMPLRKHVNKLHEMWNLQRKIFKLQVLNFIRSKKFLLLDPGMVRQILPVSDKATCTYKKQGKKPPVKDKVALLKMITAPSYFLSKDYSCRFSLFCRLYVLNNK